MENFCISLLGTMKSQVNPIPNGCKKELYPELKTNSNIKQDYRPDIDLSLTTVEPTYNDAEKNLMKKNLINGTKKNDSQLLCDQCGKSFTNNNSLSVHQRIHTGEKPYQCVTCSESFTRSDYYLAHQRKHYIDLQSKNTVGVFTCNICRKAFAYKHVLKRHEAMHNNQLNFACSICDEKFNRKDYLITHIRVSHSERNPFQCKFCKKVFRHKKSLVIHERVHTGERPYICRYCDKKFIRKDYMLQHQRVHELRDERFVCDYCEKVFKDKDLLREHILKHLHSEDTDIVNSPLPFLPQETEQVFIDSDLCDFEFYNELEAEYDGISEADEMIIDC